MATDKVVGWVQIELSGKALCQGAKGLPSTACPTVCHSWAAAVKPGILSSDRRQVFDFPFVKIRVTAAAPWTLAHTLEQSCTPQWRVKHAAKRLLGADPAECADSPDAWLGRATGIGFEALEKRFCAGEGRQQR